MLNSIEIKKLILKIAYEANKGHIGSALSISDLLVSVFNQLISENGLSKDKNSVTLSKGHAALALYSCLFKLNLISEAELNSYEKDNSLFGTHPDPLIPWVNFLGGSLGQGFTFAAGLALAHQIDNKETRHYVILSDSELNSGVIWEVAAISGTRKLNNLVVILDNNKQQALNLTKNVLIYEDVESSFHSLGWKVLKADGHDIKDLQKKISEKSDKPLLVIADTRFGAGISFMDGNIDWHYLPLTDELYEKAVKELEDRK